MLWKKVAGKQLGDDPCLALGLGPWPLDGMVNGAVYGCSQGQGKNTSPTLVCTFRKDMLMLLMIMSMNMRLLMIML